MSKKSLAPYGACRVVRGVEIVCVSSEETVAMSIPFSSREQAENNAHLFAAAKEMYNALKESKEKINSLLRHFPFDKGGKSARHYKSFGDLKEAFDDVTSNVRSLERDLYRIEESLNKSLPEKYVS